MTASDPGASRRGGPVREPRRTCVGCRQARPQGALLRLRRTPEGAVEPDPRRRGAGRGAYVCRRWKCVAEAVRRGRWAQVFRAPTMLEPEALERIRRLLQTGPGALGSGEAPPSEGVVRTEARVTETSVKPVEGGW